MKFIRAVAVLSCLFVSAVAGAETTGLYFKSTPGDYIGGGQEVLLTSGDANIFVNRNYHQGLSFYITSNAPWPNRHWWYLDLAAPSRRPLTVGVYALATRFPFQALNEPGLSLSGNGRGCNTLTGRFEVLEAEYDASGRMQRFAANFEQRCEGFMPPLYGQIRYNSTFPISGVVPAVIQLEHDLNSQKCVEATGPEGALISVNGYDSRDEAGGTNLSYTWETTTGEVASGPRFSFPLPLNGETQVRLTVVDLVTGTRASAALSVCVSDTTAPTVTILSPVAGETLIGEGNFVEVSVSDAVDTGLSRYELFVGARHEVDTATERGPKKLRLFQTRPGDGALEMEVQATARDASGNVGTTSITVYKAHDAR